MILKVRLKELLNERGMTQRELAVKAGMREAAVSELARNSRETINRKHLANIASALEIKDVKDLLYFE